MVKPRYALRLGVSAVAALLAVQAGTSAAGASSRSASLAGSSSQFPWLLTAPRTLDPGQSITSLGGRYTLDMQRTDGNLVLRYLGQPIWSASTAGHPGAYAIMQRDGNFVVYDHKRALWSSGSGGHPRVSYNLTLEQDGRFVITSPRGSMVYASKTATNGVRLTPEANPAFAGDGGDPNVVYSNGTYYAFTTGTALGNHLQVVVSSSPTGGYHSYTGKPWGSTALANTPGWEQPNTSTSPGVFRYDGHWVMFYDAAEAGSSEASGHTCLAVATAGSLSPSSPQFTDNSRGPLLCMPEYGGALDPMGIVDPRTNKAYLVFKSNDGSSSLPSHIWVAPLDSAGTGLAGQPQIDLTNNTVKFPFDTTLDDPFMAYANGRFFLMFTVGNFQSSNYREAYALCAGPMGPCTQANSQPFTNTYDHAYGPGGGSLFADAFGDWWISYAAWSSASCQSYACGAKRQLYVAPIDLGG